MSSNNVNVVNESKKRLDQLGKIYTYLENRLSGFDINLQLNIAFDLLNWRITLQQVYNESVNAELHAMSLTGTPYYDSERQFSLFDDFFNGLKEQLGIEDDFTLE